MVMVMVRDGTNPAKFLEMVAAAMAEMVGDGRNPVKFLEIVVAAMVGYGNGGGGGGDGGGWKKSCKVS